MYGYMKFGPRGFVVGQEQEGVMEDGSAECALQTIRNVKLNNLYWQL